MARPVIIMSISDIRPMGSGGAREGNATYKQFPLDTGVPGTALEFSWNAYDTGYATPRHKHAFDQFRYALEGDRQIKDGYLKPGDCGFYPEGVPMARNCRKCRAPASACSSKAPRASPTRPMTSFRAARKRLSERGGIFADGVYTQVLPDGRKINKDSHAACWEEAAGQKFRYPPPRFAAPIVMKGEATRWVKDRKLDGVEHKHLGSSASDAPPARLLRLAPGARISAHRSEDAEIFYLIDGSITYDGRRGKGARRPTAALYVHSARRREVKEIGTESGGTFFILSLPLVADIEMELRPRGSSPPPKGARRT